MDVNAIKIIFANMQISEIRYTKTNLFLKFYVGNRAT